MGNCYGEDSDSEDEYYGYYGKNNCLKPQPNPEPPQPDPPAHMSYHYEDDVRRYNDSQGSYSNEHDTYSDHTKPTTTVTSTTTTDSGTRHPNTRSQARYTGKRRLKEQKSTRDTNRSMKETRKRSSRSWDPKMRRTRY